jgi:hypothetical protein
LWFHFRDSHNLISAAMPESLLPPRSELEPQLLYRVDGSEARFATWRLTDGHEALALFTTADRAAIYQSELADGPSWSAYQPPRDTLIEILHACSAAGILYAALDPLDGNARTLFDIPQVLVAVGDSH